MPWCELWEVYKLGQRITEGGGVFILFLEWRMWSYHSDWWVLCAGERTVSSDASNRASRFHVEQYPMDTAVSWLRSCVMCGKKDFEETSVTQQRSNEGSLRTCNLPFDTGNGLYTSRQSCCTYGQENAVTSLCICLKGGCWGDEHDSANWKGASLRYRLQHRMANIQFLMQGWHHYHHVQLAVCMPLLLLISSYR